MLLVLVWPARSLYWFPHMDLWTKLRPGVRAFLDRMHLCYELHIYTHGTRPYAIEMSRILDPQRRLFAERIVSAVSLFFGLSICRA